MKSAGTEGRPADFIAGGVPGTWTIQAIGKVRPAVSISGLTPATTYVFQARAVKKAGGYSDWSDSITRVAM